MVEQQEFDRIFNKCYLAEEKVKDLQRELHKKEKEINRLLEIIRDYKIKLGEKI